MFRPAFIAAVATLLSAPVLAQTPDSSVRTFNGSIPISEGRTINAELTSQDPTLGDDTHYDCYSVLTAPGNRIQIDQTSSAFDSYLVVGGGSCTELSSPVHNDDGGGGLNARVVLEGTGGIFYILANSIGGGATGPYQISVTSVPSGGSTGPSTSIGVGQTARGGLTVSDPTLDDGSHYDCFTVQTRQGQSLQIDQMSDAFDSYLSIGTGSCANLANPESDDDGGGGTNSRLTHRGDGGILTIRVNSLQGGETGAYQLRVSEVGAIRPAPAGSSGSPPATLAQASCQRIAEAAVAFHDFRARNQELAVAMGRTGNPEIARLQPRIDRVKAWGEARGYQPREATRQDGILYASTTSDMLTEFERRCMN